MRDHEGGDMTGMRTAPRATAWTRHRLDRRTLDAIERDLKTKAAAFGFDPDEVDAHLAPLNDFDAVRLGQGPTERIAYLEHPLAADATEHDLVMNPHNDDRLLRHLHSERWRRMREREVNALTGHGVNVDALDAHYDASVPTRWCRAMARNRPEAVRSHEETRNHGWDPVIRCETVLQGSGVRTDITHNTITVRMRLPDSVTTGGMACKRLGALIDLPTCGDEMIDQAMADVMILSVSPDGTANSPKTLIELFSSERHNPSDPADARQPWRRMRSVDAGATYRADPAHGWLRCDLAATRAAYEAAVSAAMGEAGHAVADDRSVS